MDNAEHGFVTLKTETLFIISNLPLRQITEMKSAGM